MNVKAINKATGELIELPANTLAEIMTAWQVAQEYDKASTALKDQLKKLVPSQINADGTSDETNGFKFRRSFIQRMGYDKAVMRQVFDEDTFDVLCKPDKTLVDIYIKEHLEELGENSTLLRTTMTAQGEPYSTIKLEKLS